MTPKPDLIIVGGGLAGSEAAWQAAEAGLRVALYEMRPAVPTGAHVSQHLAELVCSNSLGSDLPDRAGGLLKNELRCMGSLLIRVAQETALPAGGALAVDRDGFGAAVTQRIEAHPNITLVREEMPQVPDGLTIIASGPLTSSSLSQSIAKLSGEQHLFFFDAISPIISLDSIDMSIAFRASRYDRGEEEQGDYINCPMTREEYDAFLAALLAAERIELREFESQLQTDDGAGVRTGAHEFFEGCLPVEIIAERGERALAFGPMRPVGLRDPRTGKRPYAVLQLRQDNLAGTLYNMVGFQTNLKFPDQKRVFRMIPGLQNAVFERYGQMHRNTFISSPRLLDPTLQFRTREDLFFAGQITGVEGYVGNIATGLLAGLNAARLHAGQPLLQLPPTTMLGALCHYVTHADEADFQPMKANYGIMPRLEISGRMGRRDRAKAYSERALIDLDAYLSAQPLQAA
ncbi:MAG TPA: methylenetetrahydrofolate--tRNA-(uracil(54)-C(5))-methyltransferase (FADH(2)-oxidizing) TrmFO [Anaerolineales bacterium]|nr:methylenetetrahydrofolate--tRNA-(uracil(54)-C(5))-methyltransferase (FADH(2)-oxidizing) TrmFO [Anaerolineales bacterium]HRQ92906.1 methylenetetrahydrofolate--tRNA-(uracil(54)-C(5))-methyltransferase (FADH(2)-oxidizing) TrmFO [Anaerolineales bacterium]